MIVKPLFTWTLILAIFIFPAQLLAQTNLSQLKGTNEIQVKNKSGKQLKLKQGDEIELGSTLTIPKSVSVLLTFIYNYHK